MTVTETTTGARLFHRPVATGPAYCGPGDHDTFLRNARAKPARMVLTFTPAGMERFFEETLEQAPSGAQAAPDNLDEVAARYVEAAPRHGFEFV